MSAACPPRRPARIGALLWVGCVLLSGCTWLPQQRDEQPALGGETLDTTFMRSRLIVRDLVGTLVQIPALAPQRTTLISSVPDSRFGELLIAALQDAGYDLRMAAPDEQAGRLDWLISPSRDADAGADDWTVIVSARNVRVKRSYRVDADGVRPVSAMYVHGADASRVTLDATVFDPMPIAPAPDATRPTTVQAGIDVEAIGSSAGRVDEGVEDTRTGVVLTPVPVTSATNAKTSTTAPQAEPSNMFLSGRSRYESLFASYEPIEEMVLVFPNDSLAMGRENKRFARQMAERLDRRREVISVIGCSHGATAIDDGNSILANGRAARVKEEFTDAGIDADLVLEEGCWAGVAHTRMPARGVVVTRRRHVDQ